MSRRGSDQWCRGAALLLEVVVLSACVSVERTLPDGRVERVPRAELPQYAQAVFKRRNAVSTQFLERTPLEDSEATSAAGLDDAEQRMDEACAPVDALAIAYRDGEHIGFSDKLRLARALTACAEATDAAQEALDKSAPPREK